MTATKNGNIQVVDANETRHDLARRSETKFVIRNADIAKVRRALERHCRLQVHNETVSTVRSIYFDDALLSTCAANLDGLGIRRKLRLRWYDSLLPETTFFFEVKWRHGMVTGKHRLELRSSSPLHEWTYREMLAGLEKCLPAELVPALINFPEPVVLVEYNRQHFSARDLPLRLTIDYNIRFYNQQGKRKITTRFPVDMDGYVVLEGKSAVGERALLRKLLHPMRLRAGRCSKYVHGCRAHQLIQEYD